MQLYLPQPARKIYAFDRGWRVINYVREHLFARTTVEAKRWIGYAGTWSGKISGADNLAVKYWDFCLAAGCWLAGVAQYLSAMTLVIIFLLVQSLVLAVWALLAMLFMGALSLYTFVYARFNRIFVRCPADFKTMPVPTYICDNCGREHTRLWPSIYGVFHHTCECGKALPTLTMLGRNKLRPICPYCKTPLPGIGEGTNVHIPIVGGPSTGKSNYIVMATRELIGAYAPPRGYTITFSNPRHETEYQDKLRLLNSGQVLTKTTDMRPQAYNLKIKARHAHVPKLAYVYDPAGEVFGSIAHTEEQKYYEYIDGILFVVDPFAIPAYRAKHRAQVDLLRTSIRPSDMDVEEAFSRLLEALESLKKQIGLKAGVANGQPLAVVISKVDALDLEAEIGAARASELMAKDSAIATEEDAISMLTRQFLVSNDLGGFVRDAEAQFGDVKYFSCSALGHMPENSGVQFTPIRVVDPLVWLMGRARALKVRNERVRLVDARQRAVARKMGLRGRGYYYWRSLKAPAPER
jgi:hypothetical protein